MKLPIGVSNFKELIEGAYHFIDKSPWIHEVIQDSAKVILITRPRRFGKTINISMLYYFLNKTTEPVGKDLFRNLAIHQDHSFCKEHQQQYPVIFITFKGIKELSFDNTRIAIQTLMSDLYSAYYESLKSVLADHERAVYRSIIEKRSDLIDLKNSLKKLTVYLFRVHQKKPVILIDEYDTPIHASYINHYYPEIIDLMRELLGEALKDNDFLGKAVLRQIQYPGIMQGQN